MDTDTLKTTPVDLSKLSDVRKNKVVKKDVYDELIIYINAVQSNDIINLVKKTDDTKIGEVEGNIPNNDVYITNPKFEKQVWVDTRQN